MEATNRAPDPYSAGLAAAHCEGVSLGMGGWRLDRSLNRITAAPERRPGWPTGVWHAAYPRSLAGVLEQFREGSGLRESFAGEVREWAKAERGWERNAAAYQEIYAALSG